MEKTINEINDEEQVARILFSPSHIYEGRVSPKAFKLEMLKNGAEDYISVLRNKAMNWMIYLVYFVLDQKVILVLVIPF